MKAATKTAAKAGTRTALRSTKPKTAAEAGPVRMFVSYSHHDEAHQRRLDVHLAPLRHEGLLTVFDGDINAGEKLDPAIARQMREAHIFVALLSPDYMHSRYCWQIEHKRATGRRNRGTLRMVDVVIRDCDWKETKAAQHKVLPKDGKPVTRWRSADTAWLDVVKGLKPVIAAAKRDLQAKSRRSGASKARPVPKPAAKAPARRVTPTPSKARGTKSGGPPSQFRS